MRRHDIRWHMGECPFCKRNFDAMCYIAVYMKETDREMTRPFCEMGSKCMLEAWDELGRALRAVHSGTAS